jgi:PAS domain S-box-containing protein
VMKLLAKTAEDRYQTAAGLAVDLRQCLTEWDKNRSIEPFPLGADDASDRLMAPEKLYGREHEIDTLLGAFDRVVANGATELVLVSGYAGIGKSSVVNELQKALVPPRGLFASGKFDQYKRDIPYATLAQAFRGLVRPLLSKSETELARWRNSLSEALGPNGKLIVNLIPELELVIGKQPPVADLPPQDAKNRFQMVFRRFVGVFARAEHPLALFLDDLQWLDLATLDLLEHLVTDPDVRSLLLVGAYRDNEVDPAHPLMQTLETIRDAGARVEEIVLTPLGLDDIGRLVTDALQCQPERARPLAQLVHEKTSGNPFFAIQFLTALNEDGLLAFDPVAPAWRWDIDHIRARGYTDNVVDLMVGKLKRLPVPAQEAMKQLACLGNVADVSTLTLVYEEAEEVVHAALWEAVYTGLVLRQDNAYTFLHDRIHQAAYSLIPAGRHADIHLRIGRAMLASMTPDQLAEHLLDVASQLNRGATRLIDRDEKAQVATIDLRAGRKAKTSAAYASARGYFSAGAALLDERDWDSQYELMFGLWLERAECELLSGNFAGAEQLIAELLQRGASKVDQAAVYHLKVQFHTLQSENVQAINSALACLRLFSIDIPAHPTPAQVKAEYDTVWRTLAERPIESLIDLPLMIDAELQAAMQLLSILTPPAYFTDLHLFYLLVCRMVQISMQHGTSGASAHAYAILGHILGPTFHRYGEGYRFAKLACDLVEKHGFIAYHAKVYHATGLAAQWAQPITTMIDLMQATSRTAIETGDWTFACYSLCQSVHGAFLRNDSLDAVWRQSEMALDFAGKAGFHDMAEAIVSQQRFIATMQGRTATFSTFSDGQFDEATFETQLTGNRMTLMVCLYWIVKLKTRYLSGDYGDALAAANEAKPLLWASAVWIQQLDYFYYSALTVAALFENASADEQQAWRDLLTTHREQLREWAENYPPTFGDKHALVSAEIARLGGRDGDAMRLYEQAIQSAREQGFVQNEALAHEVAGRFYAARGADSIAHACLRNARNCYLQWGAHGKVKQLDERYPYLQEGRGPTSGAATIGAPVAQLDVETVVKASQAVSGQIVLENLIKTLMVMAIEHAGAERGVLILPRGDQLWVEAEATTGRKTVDVNLRQVLVAPSELPLSILQYVVRTQEPVISDDASREKLFSADEHVASRHVRSVLCLPLIKQAKLVGVLYLENNVAASVFTPARIAVSKLLASQAAISLENARLYGELTMSEERWRNLFESVPVGVNMVGLHRRYVAANPAFQRMTGYSEAELRSLTPVDITYEDDRAASEAIMAAQMAGQPYIQHREKRYRRKDGGVIWAEVDAFLAPVAGSAPLLAGVAVDITERKRAEEALRDAQADLERMARLTTMGELTASIAHEINQPLAAIVTQSEAALRFLDRKEPDLDEVQDALSAIRQDGMRVGDVIRGLRALAGKSAPQLTKLDIDDVIREALALAGGELRRHDVVLRTELAAEDLPIMGDRVQLQQVLLNLTMNGVEAMKGVTERARELSISSRLAEPGSVLVAVEDTGTGLDPAVAERMFQPFFTTKPDGLGMGLAICRSIMEAHGGRLWISTRAPHGADVRFTIPLWTEH